MPLRFNKSLCLLLWFVSPLRFRVSVKSVSTGSWSLPIVRVARWLQQALALLGRPRARSWWTSLWTSALRNLGRTSWLRCGALIMGTYYYPLQVDR